MLFRATVVLVHWVFFFMKNNHLSYEKYIEYKSLKIPYTLVKSQRKSYSISVSVEKGVEVRVPLIFSEHFLQKMFREREEWIIQKYREVLEMRKKMETSPFSDKEKEELKKRYIKVARDYFHKRALHYVNEIHWEESEIYPETGLPFVNITIREQKTRWGSCSSRGTLSFNWKLMLAPPRILDYVVVHELCHFKYMNHSREFWNMVGTVLPDYKESRRWLKEHGSQLHL